MRPKCFSSSTRRTYPCGHYDRIDFEFDELVDAEESADLVAEVALRMPVRCPICFPELEPVPKRESLWARIRPW